MNKIEDLTSPEAQRWRALSEEWKQSGEAQPVFCKRHNIKYAQFVYWRSKFLKAAGKSRNQFVSNVYL